MKIIFAIIFCLIEFSLGQRGHYGGSRSQGYHDKYIPQVDADITNTRIGSSIGTNSPSPIPVNAHGDSALVARLSSFPAENRPFWFLNYQLLEAQRGQQSPVPQSSQAVNRVGGNTVSANGVRTGTNSAINSGLRSGVDGRAGGFGAGAPNGFGTGINTVNNNFGGLSNSFSAIGRSPHAG